MSLPHQNDRESGPSQPPAPVHRVPLHQHLAIEPRVVSGGRSHIEMRIQGFHLRAGGIAHGGVLASLLDAAQGMAAASLATPHQDIVTIQLNLNFIRPARENELLSARAEVLHHGRRTAVTRAEILTEAGMLVATSSATLMYVPRGQAVDQGGIANTG